MNNNITKTTLYFDSDLYLQIKRTALERNETITKVIEKAVRNNLDVPPTRKKSFKSKLCPGFNLGKIKGNLSRDEIYDFI